MNSQNSNVGFTAEVAPVFALNGADGTNATGTNFPLAVTSSNTSNLTPAHYNKDHVKASPAQKSFWQAITVGDLDTVKCLLQHRDISINMYDDDGEQRQGGTAIHLAILEMPTWKGSEGRNGIQTAEFVKSFVRILLDHGADIEKVCRYKGEWYLQTAGGKTKSFFPEGYDSLGLVLQFIEITRGADVIANDVTKRLELIRDLLLEHIHSQDRILSRYTPKAYKPNLSRSLLKMFDESKYTDIEIRCEGRVFKVHRMVLASRSVVFDTMFSSNLVESRENVVEVKEVDPDSLSAFLKFMYTDTIDHCHVSLASDLLVLANRYDVQDLRDMCTEVLANQLTIQNASSILSIADSTHAVELKRFALQFISENIKKIPNVSDDYSNLDANLMREILDSVVNSTTHQLSKRARLSDFHNTLGSRGVHSSPAIQGGHHSPAQLITSSATAPHVGATFDPSTALVSSSSISHTPVENMNVSTTRSIRAVTTTTTPHTRLAPGSHRPNTRRTSSSTSGTNTSGLDPILDALTYRALSARAQFPPSSSSGNSSSSSTPGPFEATEENPMSSSSSSSCVPPTSPEAEPVRTGPEWVVSSSTSSTHKASQVGESSSSSSTSTGAGTNEDDITRGRNNSNSYSPPAPEKNQSKK
mmetsp:Transcript_14256/g.30862  ORF Transcript_14256/g.30862 Transcript_14256/m.30862 type:complete len:643 (-) Transcript_14256:15-1943(-)